MTTNKNFIEFFNECEKMLPVDTWTYKKIHLWPILKWQIFNSNVKHYSPSIFIRLKQIAQLVRILFYPTNCRFKPQASDFVFYSQGQRTHFEDKWLDPLLDPIKDKYVNARKSVISIESQPELKIPQYYPAFHLRIIEAILYAIAQIVYLKPVAIPEYAKLKATATKHGFTINDDILISLSRTIKGIYLIAQFYSSLLKIIKPQRVYLTCYYSMAGTALLYAAKQLRIEAVDVQHGSNMSNFAYIGWKKIPEGGYNTIPDTFWNWSKFDVAEIKNNNSKKFLTYHKPFLGGLPWANQWLEDNAATNKYDKKVAAICADAPLKILVLTRPSFYGEESSWKMLTDLINKAPPQWFWLLRKHPAYNKLDACFDQVVGYKNVNVDEASDLPLYALFRNCDLIITTSSNASALEAYFFNKQTIFLSKVAEEESGDLLRKINCKTIETPKELLVFLKAFQAAKQTK